MKTFTLKACWDPENDCDLDDGWNAPTDERFAALKLGPFVLLGGPERD